MSYKTEKATYHLNLNLNLNGMEWWVFDELNTFTGVSYCSFEWTKDAAYRDFVHKYS